ncbi:YhgE/Pip family protein [Paenactinomyces guangxiensis]|uniref:YhgE/Pip domain-containing protein n=1 Tax=Paenactinomyces guangxiensis TaxID=1490290 RepID=A0A7W1WQG5_9BACL|nr:YhgE/Pip domain-containing protein [Paenactinomyces guangxiensis]MBA4494160.1 YhgE/Pip domain-containing protein [Paenactinomyces guangxiensis]MBH8591095.1 YhgE/Pip domain-containing protein [Paenactinomyces guangxiensis]
MMREKVKSSGFSTGLTDLQHLWASRSMRLGLLGVLAIPLVYSFIYLWAFFDPYENMKYLPVAIVNEDHGAVKDGKQINAGKELVQELEKDSKLKWEFIPRTQMKKGLKEGEYYIAVVIPRDFSQRAASADSPAPLKGQLQYYYDESNNYLSGRIGQSVIRELENTLEEKLTHVYIAEIFNKLKKSAEDLARAADGAATLADSVKKAEQGSREIKSGIHQLQSGADRLYTGTHQLSRHLAAMNRELVKTKGEIAGHREQIKKVQTMIHQLNEQIQIIAKTGKWPGQDSRIYAMEETISQINGNNDQSGKLLQELIKDHPELAADPHAKQLKLALSTEAKQHQRLQNQLSEMKQKENSLPSDLSPDELAQIAARSQKLTDDLDRAIASIDKLDQLVTGTGQLLQGAQRLEAGQSRLIDGLNQLETGAIQLQKGLGNIASGQYQLANGLHDGVNAANKNLTSAKEKENMIADPVNVQEESLHPVPNYATGFAPYFLSLSLWVGAMFLFTVIDLYRVLDKPGGEPLSLASGAIIGAAQAVICSSAIIWGLGIKPELPTQFFLFTIVMSLTFISLNRMLVALMKNVGRFLAIIFLMFQLTSSAGTYPLPLLPDFFQGLHAYMPMTYSIHGLRAALSSGNIHAVFQDSCILLAFMSGAYMVTQIYLRWVKPWIKRAVIPGLKRRIAV